MFDIIFPIVLGLLLFCGGIWTMVAAHHYFKMIKTRGTENVFSPIAIWYGYFIGSILLMAGITVISQVVFK